MKIESERAQSSILPPSSTVKPSQPFARDTLSSSKASVEEESEYTQLFVDIAFKVWDWIKYNLLFCCFDQDEETRELSIEALSGLFERAFGQLDNLNEGEFKVEFEKLSETLQDGVIEEIIKLLKKSPSVQLENIKKAIKSESDEEAYKAAARKLLLNPLKDFKIVDNERQEDMMIVPAAMKNYMRKLETYSLY